MLISLPSLNLSPPGEKLEKPCYSSTRTKSELASWLFYREYGCCHLASKLALLAVYYFIYGLILAFAFVLALVRSLKSKSGSGSESGMEMKMWLISILF